MKISPARRVAMGGIVTAMSTIMLCVASVFPTARLGNIFIASMFSMALLYDRDIVSSALSFIASSALSFFLMRDYIILLPYVALLGWYPIYRSLILSRLSNSNRVLIWALKLAACALAMAIIYLTGKSFIPQDFDEIWLMAAAIALIIAFVVYDHLYEALYRYYGRYHERITRK